MGDAGERVIERTEEFDAPIEQVWRAISDPGELSRWFGDETRLELEVGFEGAMTWEEHGSFALRVEEEERLHGRHVRRGLRHRERLVEEAGVDLGVGIEQEGVVETLGQRLAERPVHAAGVTEVGRILGQPGLRSGGADAIGRAVGRSVVDHPELGARAPGDGRPDAREAAPDVLCGVVGQDHDGDPRHGGRV